MVIVDAATTRMSRIGFVISLLGLACAGGQSGAEGNERPREPGAWAWNPAGPGDGCAAVPDDFFAFDHEAAARALEGRHQTTLAWLPIDPFDERRSIEAVLDIETRGEVRAELECGGPVIDLVATLELPGSNRKAMFSGGAYLRRGGGNLRTRSNPDVTSLLGDPGAALRGEDDRRFRLYAQLRDGEVVGGMLEGEDEPGCESARIPAERTECPYDGREIDWDTRFADFAIGDALANLQKLGGQSLVAPGDGSRKAVELTFAKGDGPVCASPFFRISVMSERIQAPITVRVKTEDGMLDHEVSAELSAIATPDGGWARIEADPIANGAQLIGRAVVTGRRLGVLSVDLKPTPEGTRGSLTFNRAERVTGWPEIELPAHANAAAAVDYRVGCVGIREGGRMYEANVDTVPAE